MLIDARQGDGRSRCDRVDPLTRGKLSSPQLLVPVATANPLSGRQLSRCIRDTAGEFLASSRAAQIGRHQGGGGQKKMCMSIDEPGCNEGTAQIDDADRSTGSPGAHRPNAFLPHRPDSHACNTDRSLHCGPGYAGPDASIDVGCIQAGDCERRRGNEERRRRGLEKLSSVEIHVGFPAVTVMRASMPPVARPWAWPDDPHPRTPDISH